jgi:hypothetical protein
MRVEPALSEAEGNPLLPVWGGHSCLPVLMLCHPEGPRFLQRDLAGLISYRLVQRSVSYTRRAPPDTKNPLSFR